MEVQPGGHSADPGCNRFSQGVVSSASAVDTRTPMAWWRREILGLLVLRIYDDECNLDGCGPFADPSGVH